MTRRSCIQYRLGQNSCFLLGLFLTNVKRDTTSTVVSERALFLARRPRPRPRPTTHDTGEGFTKQKTDMIPSDSHRSIKMAQLEQKWNDLTAWIDALKPDVYQEEHRVITFQTSDLELRLGQGARQLASVPENQEALCTLLASEIWLKEGNLDFTFGTTFELFDLLANNDFDRAVESLPGTLDTAFRRKIVTKARNLQKAAVGHSSGFDSIRQDLSFEIIQNTHQQVVQDLNISSDLRTVMVAPYGTCHMYTVPQKIQEQLDMLIIFTNEKFGWAKSLDTEGERLQKSIAAASIFFCEFLKIHPFRNGNGRTARLLLSWLLADQIVVPVSLTTKREEYMEAVAAGQWMGNPPYKLTALVTKAAAISAWNALDLFGN